MVYASSPEGWRKLAGGKAHPMGRDPRCESVESTRPEGTPEFLRPFRAGTTGAQHRGRRPAALPPANFRQAFSLLKWVCATFIGF